MKKVKRIFFLFPFLAAIGCVSTVRNSPTPTKINSKVENWVSGEIHMKNNDSISAVFTLNPLVQGGVLRVKLKDRHLTLTPRNVTKFSFFDLDREQKRTFFSVEISKDHYQFLEALYLGSYLSLYGLETTKTSGLTYQAVKYTKTKGRFQLIYFDNGDTRFHVFDKSSFLNRMANYRKPVKDFIKEQSIRFGKPDDATKLVEFCNRLLMSET